MKRMVFGLAVALVLATASLAPSLSSNAAAAARPTGELSLIAYYGSSLGYFESLLISGGVDLGCALVALGTPYAAPLVGYACAFGINA